MKTGFYRLIHKDFLSFESIYHNKGFAIDAFRFSLIEPQKNKKRKKDSRVKNLFKATARHLSNATYVSVMFLWFSVYFVVFGAGKVIRSL